MEEESESILGELEDQVTCWICFEVFTEPLTLHCGHSFCKDCCIKMYKKNPLCAFCRREFGLPLPDVNQALVDLVNHYRRKQSGEPEPMAFAGPTVEQESGFFWLPDEIVVDIFAHLDAEDLGRSALVCHAFHRLADDRWIWRELCMSRFPFVQIANYNNDWKRCFTSRRTMQRGWESGKPGDFKMQPLRGHTNYINCFDYYRNNVVSGSADNTLKIWNVTQAKPLHTLTGHTGIINAIQFNEVRIVSGANDNKVKVWDTTTGTEVSSFSHTSSVLCLQAGDSKIISSGNDRNVKIWDLRSASEERSFSGHNQAVTSVEYNGNRIISCSPDVIRITDARTGAAIRTLSSGYHQCFQTVGANELVSGGSDGSVRLWDLNTGSCVHQFSSNGRGPVTSLSSDGNKLVCNSGNDVRVFDLKRRSHVRDLQDHTAPVNVVQYDGHKVVSASADNTLKVWDPEKGTRLYSLLGGSLQQRGNNPPHPSRIGASFMKFDEGRIVAAFNSLLRVYSFTGEKVEGTRGNSSSS
ncbi:F-box/WD repeat-containing protein 7 [Balamuthia mandrillaris]